jgi:tripartite-type tricarboxylate transporter receptor subunit TctC
VREAAAKGMASAEMQQFAANGGGEISTGTPEQFAKLLASEQRRWGEVIRRNNIRAE